MVIRPAGLLVLAASLGVLGSCRDIGPSPIAPRLVLHFREPVITRFVPATGIFVPEFPATIANAGEPGGDLLSVEAAVLSWLAAPSTLFLRLVYCAAGFARHRHAWQQGIIGTQ